MKIRSGFVVNILIIVAMAVISFTPIIERNQSVFWMPSLFILWCLSAISISNKKFNILPDGPLFWAIMLILWQVFLSVIGINGTNIWGHIAMAPKYGIILIALFVLSNYGYKEKIMLLVMLSIIFVFNVLDNDINAWGHPEYFLGLNTNITYAKTTNFGSTPMTTCCLFFFPFVFLLMTDKNLKRFRWLSLFLFAIIGYYFFYLNSRGIAFFLSLFFFWEFFIASRTSNKPHRIGYFLIILIASYLIYIIALESLLNQLLNMFSKNNNLVERFSEIQEYSEYGEASGSLSGRLFLYSLSLKTWLSSPINFFLGVGVHEYENSIFGLTVSGVGHHSEFFDFLAYYGIIGGFLLYKLLSISFGRIIKGINCVDLYNKYLSVIVVFVLYGMVNNVMDSLGVSMVSFIVVPLIFDILNEKKHEYTS